MKNEIWHYHTKPPKPPECIYCQTEIKQLRRKVRKARMKTFTQGLFMVIGFCLMISVNEFPLSPLINLVGIGFLALIAISANKNKDLNP